MSGYFECIECKEDFPWEDEEPTKGELCYPCEIVTLKKERDQWKGMYDVCSRREQKCKQAYLKLKEACEFYGDPETYWQSAWSRDDDRNRIIDKDYSEVRKNYWCGGKRARQALAEAKKIMGTN